MFGLHPPIVRALYIQPCITTYFKLPPARRSRVVFASSPEAPKHFAYSSDALRFGCERVSHTHPRPSKGRNCHRIPTVEPITTPLPRFAILVNKPARPLSCPMPCNASKPDSQLLAPGSYCAQPNSESRRWSVGAMTSITILVVDRATVQQRRAHLSVQRYQLHQCSSSVCEPEA